MWKFKKAITRCFYAAKNGSLCLEARKLLLRLLIRDRQAYALETRRLVYKKLYRRYHELIKNDEAPQPKQSKQPSNYLWIFWEQGYNSAPPLVKSCINSIRKNFKNRQIMVLSAENLKEYIELPDYIVRKYRDGKIKPALYSDLIRLELLCRYGGIWMDSTVLCTGTVPNFMTESPLFVFKELCLNRKAFQYTRCSNWFISARPNNDMLLLLRKLLHAYWRDYEIDYFIFHIFLSMAGREFPVHWNAIPTFNNQTPHTMMFELSQPFTEQRWIQLCKMSAIHKLERHTDYSDKKGTVFNHIIDTYGGN